MSSEGKQENDPVAWLDQYGDRLYRFARSRVLDSFVAEDLLQETLRPDAFIPNEATGKGLSSAGHNRIKQNLLQETEDSGRL